MVLEQSTHDQPKVEEDVAVEEAEVEENEVSAEETGCL